MTEKKLHLANIVLKENRHNSNNKFQSVSHHKFNHRIMPNRLNHKHNILINNINKFPCKYQFRDKRKLNREQSFQITKLWIPIDLRKILLITIYKKSMIIYNCFTIRLLND